jgi:molybdopterin converting factor small subunit
MSAIKRPNSTYSNDASTGPSPDRLSQRHYGLERPKGLWQRARSGLCTPHDGLLNRYVNVDLNDEDVRVLDGLDTAVSERDTLVTLPTMAGG